MHPVVLRLLLTCKLSGGAGEDAVEKMMKSSVPLGRQGTKMEIATSAIFLIMV